MRRYANGRRLRVRPGSRIARCAMGILALLPAATRAHGAHDGAVAPLDLTNVILALWVLLIVLILAARFVRGVRFRRRRIEPGYSMSRELQKILSEAGISRHGGEKEQLKDSEKHLER